MLSPDGRIEFGQELMDLVDAFLARYTSLKGPLRNDLERGLVIAYVLGVLRCDIESVWDSIGQAEVFGSLQPRSLFEECAIRDEETRQERQSELFAQILERGWFSQQPDATQPPDASLPPVATPPPGDEPPSR